MATAYRVLSNKEEQERSGDETTVVVRTDDPDGTITVVTTTVIKPGGMEGVPVATTFESGLAKVI